MGPGADDVLHDCGGVGPDALTPVDQPRGRPLEMRPVGGGPMLGQRAVVVFDEAAYVTGDALAFVDDFHDVMGGAAPERLADQRIRGTVVMVVEAHVVVDIDADLLPLGVLVRSGGKRLQRRTIES